MLSAKPLSDTTMATGDGRNLNDPTVASSMRERAKVEMGEFLMGLWLGASMLTLLFEKT